MNRIRLVQSSSTKIAFSFSFILFIACIMLGTELYNIRQGEIIHPLFIQCVLVLIILICIGIFTLSFYATKRINTIVSTADQIITTRDLSKRIPIENAWHDISKLSHVLNSMLDQIDRSVTSIRQVSDNIAHDLRTPLTRLRNHVETMRMAIETTPINHADQIQEFNGLLAECDALMTTFNALLRIANIESGRRNAMPERINLSTVIEDVVALYEPTASDQNIQLSYRVEPAFVMGDKDLLFQAFANLLDNAIKHTPAGGNVVLTLAAASTGAKIVLTDTGVGIPNEHKTQVFKRFYRIESCRSTPGSGLGLSLVDAIIRMHQGTITLTDHIPTGLTVTIML